MSTDAITYIAGIGMITPVGANTDMTVAAVNAGINQFEASDYDTRGNESITMSGVPEEVFESLDVEIDEGAYYSELFDRIIKMAIVAAREAVAGQVFEKDIPLVLAMPETVDGINHISAQMLTNNLTAQEDLPLDAGQVRCIHTGRAAGIEALDLAGRILRDLETDFVLLGGSDSYWHLPLIAELDARGRALAPGVMDGFIPGEGAGFLLLTRHPDKALARNGQVVALRAPGLGKENGHMYSETPYRGDGLDQAFKAALNGYHGDAIEAIYSSQNGEQFWAREYGVALMRSQACFSSELRLEHPADCYGDLGVASGPVLIGLCASNLLQQTGTAVTQLVYCSSDTAARAALRMEKQTINLSG